MAHYFTDNRSLEHDRKEISFRFSGHLYTFTSDSGVFSKDKVDEGSEIFLRALAKEDLKGRLLDMGCGYGVLGIVLSDLFPVEAVLADVNPRAVELAEINSGKNGAGCACLVSDGFSSVEGKFVHIVTNPPIRAGKKVIYGMFEDAYTHLEDGGTLYVVIRRKQGAESAVKKLSEVFGNCEVIYREKGYWILKSCKLTY